MNLEMTPNLEDCNVKKEQVLQTEDSCFNPNHNQKLEMLQKEAEKVLEQAVPKIHQENRKVEIQENVCTKKKRKERNRGEAYEPK